MAATRAGLFMPDALRQLVKSVVTTWFGTFLLDGEEVVQAVPAPTEPALLAGRARQRREGHLTPEEEQLLRGAETSEWRTRDRRLAEHGLRYDPKAPLAVPARDLDARPVSPWDRSPPRG